MCGIAGWMLTDKPDSSFYLTLGTLMQERGEDSWGLLDVTDSGADVRRGTGPIAQGLQMGKLASLRGFLHTRQATTGKVNKKNSHPFEMAHIVGAHNGMIYNHDMIGSRYNRKLAVDSMHIFQHILDGLPLNELEGYGAIQYLDKSNGQMYVGVCNGGCFHIALTSLGVVWASTKEAIEEACFQAGLSITHYYALDDGHIYRVTNDSVYETEMLFDLRERPKIQSKERFNFTDNAKYHETQLGTAFDRAEQQFRQAWHMDQTDGEDIEFTDVETSHGPCEFCGVVADLREVYGDSFVCQHCEECVS